METWYSYFPDYNIILLDYSNISQWIPSTVLDIGWIKTHYGLAQQADIFRITLLYLHGGIWLDLDTIITSQAAKSIIGDVDKLTIIGSHIGCIASPARDPFITKWYQSISRRIAWHKWYNNNSPAYAKLIQVLKRSHRFGPGPILFRRWDYFGNSILKHISVRNHEEFISLDRSAIKALPETVAFPPTTDGGVAYLNFYFNPKYNERIIAEVKTCQGIILLHNSWTPKRIRNLNVSDFLSTKTPLAYLIKHILGIEH